MTDEIFEACKRCDSYCLPRSKVEEFVKMTTSYQARIEKLREALEFYAKESNHTTAPQPYGDDGKTIVWFGIMSQDQGSLARKALEEDK